MPASSASRALTLRRSPFRRSVLRRLAVFGCGLSAFAAARAALAQPAPQPSPPPAPEGFTRFEFEGHEREGHVFSDYLWRHFVNRGGNGMTMFNKEYLTLADMWLSSARDGSGRTIQDVHREAMLGARIDPDGYVETHQHFSHAHDAAWPFPLWLQSGDAQDATRRAAVGWHFQPRDKVRGWTGDYLRGWKTERWTGEPAAASWVLDGAESKGIQDRRWVITATGDSPTATTPEDVSWEAACAPFMQLRWSAPNRPAGAPAAWMEWTREGDADFSPDRRMAIHPDVTAFSPPGLWHSHLALYRHPLWTGRITRARIRFAPGLGPTGADGAPMRFEIDSFFTAYDTRHTINNPILILASAFEFNWTGDIEFLRANIDRMRVALRQQQTEMGGLERNLIHNPWPGHDGLSGFERGADGKATSRPGHGVGSNYWDLLPFGGDDFYATMQYYAATMRMAELEEAISRRPEWGVPRGPLALDPAQLRAHAAAVKARANEVFWVEPAGRFAACRDVEGKLHDYGFTFLNLEAIWCGVATDEHASRAMAWINGDRVVEGDTSTGADIYHWRFGPRATTLRNVDWYGQGWTGPETIPWGAQVQDGGAVLGFAFYDLWARLKILGPDDAWRRLREIADWEEEVAAAGGYRAYYAGGAKGTTLQGCGTAGGIGVDCEFYESSLLTAFITLGLAGLNPTPEALRIEPNLPADVPSMTVRNLLYHGVSMDVRVARDKVELTLPSRPGEGAEPLPVAFAREIQIRDAGGEGNATGAAGVGAAKGATASTGSTPAPRVARAFVIDAATPGEPAPAAREGAPPVWRVTFAAP